MNESQTYMAAEIKARSVPQNSQTLRVTVRRTSTEWPESPAERAERRRKLEQK